jgi:hypothetical protein
MARVLLLLAALLSPAMAIRDLDGRVRHPFAPARTASVLLFVTTDCPISNGYAPEMLRICRAYAGRGVDCLLLYEDARTTSAAVRTHRQEYGVHGIPAAIDGERTVAGAAGATTTPEAVVVDRDGAIRYRGRIDDLYADLGRRRTAATTHDLQDALDAVLAGRPVARPRAPALGCYIEPPWKEPKEPS